ncbi:unnamed protein product, partial [Closterium sp. Naga37s-1]
WRCLVWWSRRSTSSAALLHHAPVAPPPQGYHLGSLVDFTSDADGLARRVALTLRCTTRLACADHQVREEDIIHLAALRPICPLPISPSHLPFPSPLPISLPISPSPPLKCSLPLQCSTLPYLPHPLPIFRLPPTYPLHLPIRLPPPQVALVAAEQEARHPHAHQHHTLHSLTHSHLTHALPCSPPRCCLELHLTANGTLPRQMRARTTAPVPAKLTVPSSVRPPPSYSSSLSSSLPLPLPLTRSFYACLDDDTAAD